MKTINSADERMQSVALIVISLVILTFQHPLIMPVLICIYHIVFLLNQFISK